MNMTSDFKKVFETDPHLASIRIRWERGLENISQTMIRCDEVRGMATSPKSRVTRCKTLWLMFRSLWNWQHAKCVKARVCVPV